MSWAVENRKRLESLLGDRIVEATLVEMALSEEPKFVWRHESLPLIQAQTIDIILSSGRIASLQTYQNNDVFGICIEFQDARPSRDYPAVFVDADTGKSEPSIFRVAPDSPFPLGFVSDVRIVLAGDDVDEVWCTIGSHPILLKAGEVYGAPGDFSVSARDESMLLFLNPGDVARTPFDASGVWIDVER